MSEAEHLEASRKIMEGIKALAPSDLPKGEWLTFSARIRFNDDGAEMAEHSLRIETGPVAFPYSRN
jgi:hypothetical protein